jgi:mannose-6-phosphate isomerase-like protein (cupin superfamily)
MNDARTTAGYEVVDFDGIAPVDCPCGTARRAFAGAADFPATMHRTEITTDARLHYHKRLTEAYYILDCQSGAQMQLDDQRIDLRPGMGVLIRPGVRHRALGRMTVLIVATPKFDPDDEWFD